MAPLLLVIHQLVVTAAAAGSYSGCQLGWRPYAYPLDNTTCTGADADVGHAQQHCPVHL